MQEQDGAISAEDGESEAAVMESPIYRIPKLRDELKSGRC